jgi:hypothetical protein
MISSSLASGRRRFAAILFGAGAFVLAACESANTGSGANPSSLGVLPEGVADPAITTCGDCWTLYPVGPFVGFGGSNTRITGLSNDSKVTSGTIKVPSCTPRIVGVSFEAPQVPYTSFVADPHNSTCKDTDVGSYTTPNPEPPNNYIGTYLSAVSNGSIGKHSYAVGFSPPISSLPTCGNETLGSICGLIYDPGNGGLVSLVQDKSSCGKTYLYGTSDTRIQVGYYTKEPGCEPQAVEEYSPSTDPNKPPVCTIPPFSYCGAQFADFHPPGTSPTAYGINTMGEVVGTDTTSGETVSWKYTGLQYSSIPTYGTSTQALGIDFADHVVGSYTDISGTHGFVQIDPTHAYEINYPGSNATVVNSINDQKEIVGWYGTSTAGFSKGFVGFCWLPPMTSNCPGNSASSGGRGHSTLTGGIGSAIRPRR